MSHVSDIKLIRTDTTLDLSQKAEKGILLRYCDEILMWGILRERSRSSGTSIRYKFQENGISD